jgi:hypothetical protein
MQESWFFRSHDRKLRGNPVRCRQASMPELPPQLSAASCCPVDVTEASRLREDRTTVMTREPGDLPRPRLRPRAGCPGGRLLGWRSAIQFSGMRPLGLCPNAVWGLPMSVTREANGEVGPPLPVPANSPTKQFATDCASDFSECHKLSVPKTTQPLRIAWIDAVGLAACHLLALLAFVPWLFSWTGVGLAFFGLYIFGTLGISLCFHRLLTHRGVVCPKWLEHTLAVLGVCCLQDTPARWVAIHRRHHQHADEQPDPHSPLVHFLWAHWDGSF